MTTTGDECRRSSRRRGDAPSATFSIASSAVPSSSSSFRSGSNEKSRVSLGNFLDWNKEQQAESVCPEDRRVERGRRKRKGVERSYLLPSQDSVTTGRTGFTGRKGIISVRDIRRSWGAMFLAAILGSFIGTGGVHRLLNRRGGGVIVVPAHSIEGSVRGNVRQYARGVPLSTSNDEDKADRLPKSNYAVRYGSSKRGVTAEESDRGEFILEHKYYRHTAEDDNPRMGVGGTGVLLRSHPDRGKQQEYEHLNRKIESRKLSDVDRRHTQNKTEVEEKGTLDLDQFNRRPSKRGNVWETRKERNQSDRIEKTFKEDQKDQLLKAEKYLMMPVKHLSRRTDVRSSPTRKERNQSDRDEKTFKEDQKDQLLKAEKNRIMPVKHLSRRTDVRSSPNATNDRIKETVRMRSASGVATDARRKDSKKKIFHQSRSRLRVTVDEVGTNVHNQIGSVKKMLGDKNFFVSVRSRALSGAHQLGKEKSLGQLKKDRNKKDLLSLRESGNKYLLN